MEQSKYIFVQIVALLVTVFSALKVAAQSVDNTNLSIDKIEYVVEVKDTETPAQITHFEDCYYKTPGVFTFRGSAHRDMPQGGKLKEKPSGIRRVWTFKTAFDTRETPYGTWGGGSGWTGQPLYVEWPDELLERQRNESPALTENFSKREVMVGSLAGYVYFIDYESGRASRKAHKCGNPIKGTMSLDPRLNGNLYIGQGIPADQPFGAEVFNLYSHKRISFFGYDARAWRRWGAYDPSPIVVDNFVIRISENGTIYKFTATEDSVKLHSLLRYRRRGNKAYGAESSPAVWQNYLYFSDNIGNILCVDINTMKPVWHYDNRDDSDATVVIAEERTGVFLYSGSAVDKQGDSGYCRLVKLDARSGALVWENKIACSKIKYGDKVREGGMFSTPLLGHGNCEGLMFTNICGMGKKKGAFIAVNRATGEILYQVPLQFYAWSSPVALYTPDGHMYIVTGDVIGNLYLIDAKSGEVIYRLQGGNNFESSPIVVDNCIVVGSRGREIHKFEIY
ncbi:MAG: PQQ-binding-like beta-propeller repeat protein [Alistipes sp.]|nr:PQQ-binding-like beta-propeller repeat protein [Alistipes sp.]